MHILTGAIREVTADLNCQLELEPLITVGSLGCSLLGPKQEARQAGRRDTRQVEQSYVLKPIANGRDWQY